MTTNAPSSYERVPEGTLCCLEKVALLDDPQTMVLNDSPRFPGGHHHLASQPTFSSVRWPFQTAKAFLFKNERTNSNRPPYFSTIVIEFFATKPYDTGRGNGAA